VTHSQAQRTATDRPTISVVTATYNAATQLPRLIESLRHQTDKAFEWAVADGASEDGTMALLRSITDLNMVISSQPDFGVYDALNRAIKVSSGTYYIVMGADDELYSDAIANFRRAIETSGADLIAARAQYRSRVLRVKRGPVWLYSQSALIAIHSLATAFRKDLHATFGYYTRHYPIAADHHFVIRACLGGASRFESDFVAGIVGDDGVSSVDWVGGATEVFRVQIVTGRSPTVQTLLLLIRLLRGWLTQPSSSRQRASRPPLSDKLAEGGVDGDGGTKL
jgi:glycosyltransferase involved in cell wall biosynthesis